MSDWMVPLTTGQILDRTFLIFKHHFGRLLLLALLFIGPALLIGILGVILLFAFGLGVDMLAAFDGSYSDAMLFVMLIGYLILFLVLIFSGLGTILLNGSAMFLLDHLRKGLKPKLGTLIRWSFKRFFPMLGAYFCCNAILGVGSNVLTLIIYMFVMMIVIAAAAGGTVGVVLSGILMILSSLAAMGAYYYFYLRLDFATAATAMAPVSPGLLQTWRLTRSRVGRILCVFTVASVIVGIFLTIVAVLFILLGAAINQDGVIALLVMLWFVMAMLLSPIVLAVAKAVLYFDLEIRNNAGDLRVLANKLTPPDFSGFANAQFGMRGGFGQPIPLKPGFPQPGFPQPGYPRPGYPGQQGLNRSAPPPSWQDLKQAEQSSTWQSQAGSWQNPQQTGHPTTSNNEFGGD